MRISDCSSDVCSSDLQPVETAIRAFETGLRPGVHVQGQPQVRWTLAERMAHYKVPGVSIAVIRDGRSAWARGYGVLQSAQPERAYTATPFSAGQLRQFSPTQTAVRPAATRHTHTP